MEKHQFSEKTDECDTTQAQLAAFVAEELDRDTERQIQAHVLECDACEHALSQLIETTMTPELTEVFYRPMPSAPDPIMEALGAQADPQPQDIDWSSLQTLNTNPPPSVQATREAVHQALLVLVFTHETNQSAIRSQWNTRSALQARSGTRAAGHTAEVGIQVAVVNPAGETQADTVTFTLSEPPTLTPDREFVATLRTDDPRVAGGSLRCTVRLNETQSVTFTGAVQPARDGTGWVARIRAEGLPVLAPAAARDVPGAARSGSDALPPTAAPDVVIPIEQVTWSVQVRPKPAGEVVAGRAVLIGIKHSADVASQAAASHGLQEAIGLYLLLTHPDYGALAADQVLLLLDGTDADVREAVDIAIQWLMQECGVSVQPGIIEEIVEKRLLPIPEEMVAAIRSAAHSATADETLLLYVAGQVQATEGRGYLLSPQTRPPLYFWTALPLPQVVALLQASQARDTVFLLDATYTGEVTDSVLSQEQLQEALFAKMGEIAVFAAGMSGEQGEASGEPVGQPGLSPFTTALLEGLSGKADPESTGSVTLADLTQYVTDRVTAFMPSTVAADRARLMPYLHAPQAERIIVSGKRPAAPQEAAEAGRVIPQSEEALPLDVRIWVQSTSTPFRDGVPGETPQPRAVTPTFQIQQALRLGVATTRDAWVYVLDVNTVGQITQLLPSQDWPDHRLRGQRRYFFSKETDPYDLEAEGPPGVETFLAIATLAPLALLEAGVQTGEKMSPHELARVADTLSDLPREQWAIGQVQFVVRA